MAYAINEQSSSSKPILKYKKIPSVASCSGEEYEWKTLTLVYLRLLSAGHEFQLASNMEAAGLFDDIALRYRKHSIDPWKVAYLQLKYKKKEMIWKPELLGLSGDFSLLKCCASYSSSKNQFIMLTNASIDEGLVDEVLADPLLSTGGKVFSFKAGGEVYRELCEWVDFKEALTELHGQVDGKSGEEVGTRVKDVLECLKHKNKSVTLLRDDLMATPTLYKLNSLLDALNKVCDKNTISLFLAKFQVYTDQVDVPELDAIIREDLAKIWIRSDCHEDPVEFHSLEREHRARIMALILTDTMSREIFNGIKLWWQNGNNNPLTQESPLWLSIVKSQIESLSKSTVNKMTESSVAFEENCLQVLHNEINKLTDSGGIFNLRVNSRTAASSLKVHRYFLRFGAWDLNVLQVNLGAFLEQEAAVMSAWATRWCRVLVLECNVEIGSTDAARISARISEVVGGKDENKLLVLIAPEDHEINIRLRGSETYTYFRDACQWNDLTIITRGKILSTKLVINGEKSPLILSELLGGHCTIFVDKVNLEVISLLITRDISCGRILREENDIFVPRRLKASADGVPFVVNSVSDVESKVVLVVAEAGMGKSTLMTHLAKSAKEEDPSALIVHIKLNELSQNQALTEMDHFDKTTATEFLEQAAFSAGNCLEKLVFGTLQHCLVVLIDGVDEVCPHYERQVFTIMRLLKDMAIRRLWVTSRPVVQAKLEDVLGVRAHSLVPFSEEDQKEFFVKVSMLKVPAAKRNKCNKETESLLTWLNNTLVKENSILQNPFMAATVADMVKERVSIALGTNGEVKEYESFDVMHLFRTFVEKNFQLYCRELAANGDNEATLLKRHLCYHQLAALRVLFSRDEIAGLQFQGKQRFDDDLTLFLMQVSDGEERTGIISHVVDGIPQFVHRSYAEFFAATWLADNYKSNRQFVERILFEPEYKQLGEMFNRSLAANQPIHVAVLNRDFDSVMHFLPAQSNSSLAEDQPIHPALLKQDLNSVAYFMKAQSKSSLAENQPPRVPLLDRGLDSVVCFRNVQPKPCDVNALDAGGRTPLHLAVLLSGTDPHPDCIRIVQYLVQEHKARLDVADEVLGWLPLRYAFLRQDLVQLLLSHGADNYCCDKDGWTPLHHASSQGYVQAATLLLQHGAEINIVNDKGWTPLHTAVYHEKLDVVTLLLKHGADPDCRDNDGWTPLLHASSLGYKQIVSLLLRHGADVESRHRKALTPLQGASITKASSGEDLHCNVVIY